jgi:hypothetical protein
VPGPGQLRPKVAANGTRSQNCKPHTA